MTQPAESTALAEPPESCGSALTRWLDAVHCGDNCDLMGQLPRNCIDLVVTSPPYDDLRTYGGHGWDFYGVAWSMTRILKSGGVVVWVVGDATKDGTETGSSLQQALHFKTLGLNLHDTMIYETTKPPMNDNRYEPKFEYMDVFSKCPPKTWNPIKEPATYAGKKTWATHRNKNDELIKRGKATINDMKVRGNIWKYGSGNGKDDVTGHPAQFPLKLAMDHVSTWSEKGDIVLDPFMGSGTTAKAAQELGRRYIGFEVHPEYVEICRQRTAQTTLGI